MLCNVATVSDWDGKATANWMQQYDIAIFHGDPPQPGSRSAVDEFMNEKLPSRDGLVVVWVSGAPLTEDKHLIAFHDAKTSRTGKRYMLSVLDTVGYGLMFGSAMASKQWELLLRGLRDRSAMESLLRNDLSAPGVSELRRFFSERHLAFLGMLCALCQKYLLVHFPDPANAPSGVRIALDRMGWASSIAAQTNLALKKGLQKERLTTEDPSWWQGMLRRSVQQGPGVQQQAMVQQRIHEEWSSPKWPDELAWLLTTIYSRGSIDASEKIAHAFIEISDYLYEV